MGIEDRLRDIESAQSDSSARGAERAAHVRDKAARANQLLQQFSRETLPLLVQRNHPRCLEIVSVAIKGSRLVKSSYKVQVTSGQSFTLLNKNHRWGHPNNIKIALRTGVN